MVFFLFIGDNVQTIPEGHSSISISIEVLPTFTQHTTWDLFQFHPFYTTAILQPYYPSVLKELYLTQCLIAQVLKILGWSSTSALAAIYIVLPELFSILEHPWGRVPCICLHRAGLLKELHQRGQCFLSPSHADTCPAEVRHVRMPHVKALFITWEAVRACALKRSCDRNLDSAELNTTGVQSRPPERNK